jgi:hypothetical protein
VHQSVKHLKLNNYNTAYARYRCYCMVCCERFTPSSSLLCSFRACPLLTSPHNTALFYGDNGTIQAEETYDDHAVDVINNADQVSMLSFDEILFSTVGLESSILSWTVNWQARKHLLSDDTKQNSNASHRGFVQIHCPSVSWRGGGRTLSAILLSLALLATKPNLNNVSISTRTT